MIEGVKRIGSTRLSGAAPDAARREQAALQAGLEQSRAVARRQGVAVEEPSVGGALVTARDGFTWLCGSSKRKAQLSQAQIAAGLRHRSLIDAARGSRVTADYRRLGDSQGAVRGGANRVEVDLARRLAAAGRLRRSEADLSAAHPAFAAVVRWVVEDGLTLAAAARLQGRPEPVVLEVLRLALDKLAEIHGFRSVGSAAAGE
jgi:hypothetical protein